MRTLTAFTLYCESTTDELKQQGRSRVPATELAKRWKDLSDADRKPWEDKAAAAQEAYLQECTQRFLDKGDDGEPDEEADGGDEEPNEGEGEGEEAEGADDNVRTSAKTVLPRSKVKRIAQDHLQEGHLGKEATFIVCKVSLRAKSGRLPPRTRARTWQLARACFAMTCPPPVSHRRRQRSSSIGACGAPCATWAAPIARRSKTTTLSPPSSSTRTSRRCSTL